MSRAVGLRCKTCNQKSELCFNHGDNFIRAIVKMAPVLVAAWRTTQGGDLWRVEMTVMGDGGECDDFLPFLAEHHEHKLEIWDEYGCAEPLTGDDR